MIQARLVLAIVLAANLSARGDGPAEDLNAQVLEFAKSHRGEQVGNGQCTELAREALREAGARRFTRSDEGEITWGELVVTAREVRPGDIVQFEDAVFRGRKRIIAANGMPAIVTSTQTFPHHTAVVAAVDPRRRAITLLHQNNGGDLTVQEAVIVMTQLRKGGSVKFYRPVAPDTRDGTLANPSRRD